MPIVVLSLLAQVLCAVHIIKTGRNQLWLWAVALLSLAGCAAYFAVEILPGLWRGREASALRGAAIKRLDPERELRAARDELDLAETSRNRIRVGDALTALDRHAEAVPLFRAALAGTPAADPRTSYKLASALLEAGDAAAALALADDLPKPGTADGDRAELLRGRIFEALGRRDDAMACYAELVTRHSGEEVRCRYAHLLIEAGRRAEARTLLVEVGARASRLTRRRRAEQGDMYDWAATQLEKLA